LIRFHLSRFDRFQNLAYKVPCGPIAGCLSKMGAFATNHEPGTAAVEPENRVGDFFSAGGGNEYKG
jgi:hypothetical protein